MKIIIISPEIVSNFVYFHLNNSFNKVDALVFDNVNVRIYEPEHRVDNSPALIWIHGGGWVAGSAGEWELIKADSNLASMCWQVYSPFMKGSKTQNLSVHFDLHCIKVLSSLHFFIFMLLKTRKNIRYSFMKFLARQILNGRRLNWC